MSNEVVASQQENTKAKADKPTKPAKEKVSFFKRIGRYLREVKSEFKKIVWPSKKQVLQNTGVVLLFMAIAAVIIWALDWVFINIFQLMF